MSSAESRPAGGVARVPAARSSAVPTLLMVVGVVAGGALILGGAAMRVFENRQSWLNKLRIRPLSVQMSGQIYTAAGIALVILSHYLRRSALQRPDNGFAFLRGGVGGVEIPVRPPAVGPERFHGQAQRAKDLHAYMRAQIGAAASELVEQGKISSEDLARGDAEVLASVCRYAAYLTVNSSEWGSVACGERLSPVAGLDLSEPIELLQRGSSPPATRFVQVSEDGEERSLRVFAEDDAFTAWNQPVDTLAIRRALDALIVEHDTLIDALIEGDQDALGELDEEARERFLIEKQAADEELTEEERKNLAEHVCLGPLFAMGAQIERRYLSAFEIHYSSEDGVFIKDRVDRDAASYQRCANMPQLVAKGMKEGQRFLKSQVEVTEDDKDWTPDWYTHALFNLATCNALTQLEIVDDDGNRFSVKLGPRVLAVCDSLEGVKERGRSPEQGFYCPSNAVLPREGTTDARNLVAAIENIQALSGEELELLRLSLMEEALREKDEDVPSFPVNIREIRNSVQMIREWWSGSSEFPRYLWPACTELLNGDAPGAILPADAISPWLRAEVQGEWRPLTEAYLEPGGIGEFVEPAPMHYSMEEWMEEEPDPAQLASPNRDHARRTVSRSYNHVLKELSKRGQLIDTRSLHDCIYEAFANAAFKNPSTDPKPGSVGQLRDLVAEYILDHEEEWMELVGATYPPYQDSVEYEADFGRMRFFSARLFTNVNGLNVQLPQGMELTEDQKRIAVQKYANGIRLGNIWGGEETLQALSAIFDRPVWVYDLPGTQVEVPVATVNGDIQYLPTHRFGENAGGQPIELVRKSSIHYMCLRAW